jgi:hypothetical protein
VLLVETVHLNPFSATTASGEKLVWGTVAEVVSRTCKKLPYPLTHRTAQDRVGRLLAQFKSEDGLKRKK